MTEQSKQNILIVDDEEIVRNVCSRSLRNSNLNVEFAENGAQALEKLRRQTFEIVFTDLKMPIMNGEELLDAVKRDYPYTEVILMTAYATVGGAISSMKKGAYDFILKPIKPDQIRHVVEKCLEKLELREENRELRLANQKLLELQSMKDKFIAITSHELRTPVSHLKGYLDILSDDSNYPLSMQEKKEFMQIVKNAVGDLEDIVTRMHDLIHVENGKLKIAAERIHVNSLIDKIIREYRFYFEQRKQKLEFRKGREPLDILADRTQIKGVIRELIQNANKFTPDGGSVEVKTQSEGDFCVISVKDNGIGIDTTEQGRIFEKFYEVHDTKHHSSSKNGFMGGGLGLGLSTARSIAAAHGGGIKVISQKEKGSEFLVYLPLAGCEFKLN